MRLTNSNPFLSERELAKQEAITYKARDGLELEAILIHPVTLSCSGLAVRQYIQNTNYRWQPLQGSSIHRCATVHLQTTCMRFRRPADAQQNLEMRQPEQVFRSSNRPRI